MSITGEITRINANIAAAYTACESKRAVMPASRNSANLPAAIDSIGTEVSRKDVNFYDYDGTLLYSYTAAQVQALTQLPPLPSHTGLTAQSWTHSDLSQLKSFAANGYPGYTVDIGATYTTADGSTKLYFFVPKGTRIPSLQIWVNMAAETSAAVDWGDGTTSAISNSDSSAAAVYAEKTDYTEAGTDTIICVRIVGGSLTLGKGGDYTVFGGSVSSVAEYSIQPGLMKVELGGNCTGLESNCFSECRDLRSVVISSGVASLGTRAFYNCTALSTVVIPKDMADIGDDLFYGCLSLVVAVFPVYVTNSLSLRLGSQTFYNCYSLKSIMLPINLSGIPAGMFRNCRALTTVAIPPSVADVDTYAFAYLRRLSVIDLTHFTNPERIPTLYNNNVFSTASAYLRFRAANSEMLAAFAGATNWSFYADRFTAG